MTEDERFEQSKLISLLVNGSEYAFRLLYDLFRNRIYKLALRFLKSPTLSQEVVQDVFLKLWLARKNIDASKPLDAWLLTVAKHALINRFKKLANEWSAMKQYKQAAGLAIVGADSKILTSELQELLEEASNTLSKRQKIVYEFARVQGFSYNEIGLKLKISPLTVKTHLARATERVRVFICQQGITYVVFLLLL